MAELDLEEEEEVAGILAAAEVLSGSMIEAEAESAATNSGELAADAPPEMPETAPFANPFSESTTSPIQSAAPESRLFDAGAALLEASGEPTPPVSSPSTIEPADSTTSEAGLPSAALGESAEAAPVVPLVQAESNGPAGTTPGTAAVPAKAQFRNAPGTSKFFRRGTDRHRRPGGYESREEGSTIPS